MDGVLDKGSIIQLLNSHREEVSEFGVEEDRPIWFLL